MLWPNAIEVGFGDLRRVRNASSLERFRRDDLDSEPGEPDIGELGRGEQSNRGYAEVLEDLCAEPDFAPLPRARNLGAGRAGLRNGVRGHARRAVAQEDDDAAAFLFETLQ